MLKMSLHLQICIIKMKRSKAYKAGSNVSS